MNELTFRPDIDEVRERLTTWWNGGDIGRPVMKVFAPREEPIEVVEPVMEPPEGWTSRYSTVSYEYRVFLSRIWCVNKHYLAEAIPTVAPDLAPNCLALFLGCGGVETARSVWCEPCIESPESARFEVDEDNFYWDFCKRLAADQRKLAEGKFLLEFPDLIELLDTLAAMRGTEDLLVDLIERPDWVHASLSQLVERYFDYYDRLYDMVKDRTGGSVFWVWAPGRMTKLQCDFSAMIGPEMFGEFMVPYLREMIDRVDYCLYHWDGPGAIPHHDHLLSLEKLPMIQWVPGSGVEHCDDERWWPLYHKTLEAGKKVMISVRDVERLRALRREFGRRLHDFHITARAETLAEAEELIRAAEG
jgi:5-methyltetrahydrofolate--homocysteine methyltransferase